MRLSAASALAVVASIMLAGALLIPVSVVQVQPDGMQPIICQKLATGGSIELSFTHSMYGGLVTETWRPEGPALARTRMFTENAAAAEYYAWDGRIQPAPDGYEVIASPARTTQLRVMVDDLGNHHLRIGSQTWSLTSLLDTPVPITISVSQQPLATWLVNRSC